jgi:hypothetical protein
MMVCLYMFFLGQVNVYSPPISSSRTNACEVGLPGVSKPLVVDYTA